MIKYTWMTKGGAYMEAVYTWDWIISKNNINRVLECHARHVTFVIHSSPAIL